MAKRHHSSKHHSRHGGHYNEHYAGEGARRTQEMQDAGMIREDHSAMANMPQGIHMKPWPVEGHYLPENLDDTISGIDHQMGMDNSKKMKHFMPKKV